MSTFDTFLYEEKKAARRIMVASTAMRCNPDPDENRIKMLTTVDSIMQIYPNVELAIFGRG